MNHYLEKDKEFLEIGKNYENLAIKKQNKKKYNEAITNYLKALQYYNKQCKQELLRTNIRIKLSELMMLNDYPDAPKKGGTRPTFFQRSEAEICIFPLSFHTHYFHRDTGITD